MEDSHATTDGGGLQRQTATVDLSRKRRHVSRETASVKARDVRHPNDRKARTLPVCLARPVMIGPRCQTARTGVSDIR